MATESIFTNIILSDPKEVQMFIDALEASEKDLKKETKPSIAPLLMDLDEIRNLLGVETYNDKKQLACDLYS